MQAGSSSVVSAPKAGFWIRFVAYVLDALIVGIPLSILAYIAVAASVSSVNTNGPATTASGPSGLVLLVYLLAVVASIAYFVYFWSSPEGQTLGMKALNLRVVKTDGSRLTVGAAIARWLGTILNSIVFGLPIGWVWAAFDANKQGWHDKIAGTYVIKKT